MWHCRYSALHLPVPALPTLHSRALHQQCFSPAGSSNRTQPHQRHWVEHRCCRRGQAAAGQQVLSSVKAPVEPPPSASTASTLSEMAVRGRADRMGTMVCACAKQLLMKGVTLTGDLRSSSSVAGALGLELYGGMNLMSLGANNLF